MEILNLNYPADDHEPLWRRGIDLLMVLRENFFTSISNEMSMFVEGLEG